MSDFWLYFKLGLTHVLDWTAYDHVLFIIVLCVAYSFASWRKLLVLVTLFTVGHTASLFLSNYGIMNVSAQWIEFLIPITIITTAAFNIVRAMRSPTVEKRTLLFLITPFFGLVHGFGFGRYFNLINDEQELLPLLEFALGIEAAQLIVVLLVLITGYLSNRIYPMKRQFSVLLVSFVVILLSSLMLIENWPF
jgi:HupE/UreJ protein